MFQTSFVGPRSTCDLSVNTAGRELIDLCKTYGLYILNGRFQPDKDIGNFTHLCINYNDNLDINIIMDMFLSIFREDFKKKRKKG